MTETSNHRDEAFDRVVHEYYQAIEHGNRVEPQAFIDQHPEFKEDLQSFFADLKNLGESSGVAAMPKTVAFTSTGLQENKMPAVGPGSALTYIGEYRILDEIARGGMGVVFKASQEKLRRTVALKMILAGHLASDAEVDRFQREARAAAALQHPNIVGVHEIGVHDGHHYFTMDYIESVSLSDRLREGSLAPREAAKLLELLARATHYAHQQGVLHRDLKPANILMDAAGQPHITDFGLAKPLAEAGERTQEEITRSGQIIGTPSYMAPEQAAAKHQLVSVASDVYSLGAILYACLSGRAPFVAESTVETLRQVIHDDPLPTRLLNPRVPRDLETVCLKCLSKEPRHRYQTAAELADDLTRFLDGRPVVARPVNALVKTWRMAKRNPWAAVSVTLLCLIAVISPLVAMQQYRQSRELAAKAGRIEHQKNEISGLLSAKEQSLQRALTAEQKAIKSATLAQAETLNKRRLLYISDMQRMAGLHDEANIRAMQDLLTRQTPKPDETDLRDLEWYYWQQKCHSQLVAWNHGGPVDNVEVSPSGRWLASYDSAQQGTTIQIRDAQTGDLEKTVTLPETRILALKFRNDQELMVAGQGQREVVQVIRWRSGDVVNPVLAFPASRGMPVSRYAISKTTGLVAKSLMGNLRCYDARTGQSLKIRLSEDADVSKYRQNGVVHKDQDGRYVEFMGRVSGVMRLRDRGAVRQFNPFGEANGLEVWETGNEFTPSVDEDGGPVFALAFSAAEDLLAAGSRAGRVKIWDLTSGQEILDFAAHQGTIWDLDFSADDRQLVSVGEDGLVKIWKLPGGTLQAELTGHTGAIHSVAVGRDGSIVTGGADHVARQWRLPGNQPVASFRGNQSRVSSVCLSPDQQSVWTAGQDGQVRQWPVAAAPDSIVVADASPFQSIDVSADQTLVAACGHRKGVTVWDFQSGGRRFLADEMSMYPIFHVKIVDGGIWAFRWDGTLLHWDLGSGQRQVRKQYRVEHLTPMINAAISPHGQRVAVHEQDGQVRIDSISGVGGESVTLPSSFESSVSVGFSPDGKKLVTHILRPRDEQNADKVSLQLWNAQSGEWIADVARGPTFHGTFSATGDRLAYVENAIANAEGKERVDAVVVWEPKSQQAVARLPQAGITSLAISPDGTMLAMVLAKARAADSPTEISVRRVSDGEEIHRLAIAANKVAFSSDGLRLQVIENSGRIALVDLASGRVVQRLVNSAGRITSVAYSPSKAKLAATFTNNYSSGHSVISRDDPEVQQLSLIPNNIRGSSKTPVVYLPDGQLTYRGLVWQQCELESGVKIRHKLGQRMYLREAVASSANVCFFLAPDRSLFRFDLTDVDQYAHTAQPVQVNGACSAIAATADGRLVAIAFPGEIRIYDGMNLSELDTIGEIEGQIRSLSFNHDGSLLAAGGTGHAVQIWHTSSGSLQASVFSHSSAITCVRFSARGETIISASEDGKIQLSDVTTGTPKTTLDDHVGPVHWIELSPSGDEFASAGDDGTIRFWRAPGAGRR
jgi:WD40 repeat protein/tRNA A-37 threonylcarbamoyl transferase component Bud32